MPTADDLLAKSAAGVRLTIRVSPGASGNKVGAAAVDSAGMAYLKVRVTAAAEGGKANAAVIKLLSKAWRLPKGAFSINAGHRSRVKVLNIDAPYDYLAAYLDAADNHLKE